MSLTVLDYESSPFDHSGHIPIFFVLLVCSEEQNGHCGDEDKRFHKEIIACNRCRYKEKGGKSLISLV